MTEKTDVPKGTWDRCKGCGHMLFAKELEENLFVCPKCDYHHKVPGRKRIHQLADEGSFEEHDAGLKTLDPLEFVDWLIF